MVEFPASAYERPGLAVSNLVALDPVGALNALFAPQELSPEQMRTLRERILPGPKDRNPILRLLMGISTNPIFIMGALMSFKFPPARAKDLFKIAPKYDAYARTINPITKHISSPETIFPGTKVPELMQGFISYAASFQEKYGEKLGMALYNFRKKMGRAATWEEVTAAAIWRDQLAWRRGFGRGEPGGRERYPWLTKEIELPKHLQGIGKAAGEMLDDIYTEVRQLYRGEPEFRAALRAKNIGVPGRVESYFPHMLSYPDTMEEWNRLRLATQSLTEKQRTRYILQEMAKGGPVSSHMLPRYAVMFPDNDAVEVAKKFFPDAWSQEGYDSFKRLVESVRVERLGEIRKILGGKPSGVDTVRYLRSRLLRSRKNVPTGASFLVDMKTGEKKQIIETAKKTVKGPLWKLGYRGHTGDIIVKQMADYLDDLGVEGAMTYAEKLVGPTANVWPYSLSLNRVASDYIQRMGTMAAWAGRAKGFLQEWLHLKAAGRPVRARMLEEYMDMLRGSRPVEHSNFRLWWIDRRFAMMNWFGDPKNLTRFGVPEATAKRWGPSVAKMIQDTVTSPRGDPQAGLAAYFYLSTLGFNPSSAIKNLLQTQITTFPFIGWKYMGPAHTRVAAQTGDYMRYRFEQDMSDAEAFRKAYPDFTKVGLSPAPISEEALRTGVSGKGTIPHAAGRAREVVDEIKTKFMTMFTASERYNRLLSFEAGRLHGVAGGLGDINSPEVLRHATRLVSVTQFTGGPMGVPYGLRNAPAWARQFLHFPTRYLEFLRGSTIWGSGAVGPGYGRRQWGTIGRSMAASAAIYEAAKDVLGVDMSGGLAIGALPLPTYEEAPFFPFPVVPPAFSIAGAGLKAAATGEVQPLKDISGLLVPGGIAGKRVYRTLAPKFAGYKERTRDGYIPIYSERGALVGYKSPVQLFLKSVGFRMKQDVQEPQLVQYLTRQRDKIREYRRRYAEAALKNDWVEVGRIQEEFQKKYPELGPIELSEGDVKAFQKRREMTRIARILQGMPSAYRARFQQIAAAALGPEFFGEGMYSPAMGGMPSTTNLMRSPPRPVLGLEGEMPRPTLQNYGPFSPPQLAGLLP